MKIAITGSTGFVGKQLVQKFVSNGDEVIQISRNDFSEDRLSQLLSDVNIVINLAGSSIIKRWSEKYKEILKKSRIDTTKMLLDSIEKLEKRPEMLISTSAVGIYKNIGIHNEDSTDFADSFLSNLCQNWESEAKRGEDLGMKVAIFRFGVVLGKGGALQKMLLPFKLGLGGKIGTGKQAVSFIQIDDLIDFYTFAIENKLSGIFNLGTPEPTTNLGMTKALGKVLFRPTIFPLPAFVVKLIFGEGAKVLIDGETMFPKRILESGFKFKYPDIESALRKSLS
jgi:uncharacterized protein (TIGR01777 family)